MQIYDNVTTPEHLEVAEGALVRSVSRGLMTGLHHMTDHVTICPTSFRRSLSRATPALPLVVIRACIRVGRAEKALQYIREKVHL